MTRSSFVSALSAATLLAVAAASHADVLSFKTLMSGPNEFPPNNSPGTGFALVNIDTLANTMDVFAQFSGLGSPTAVAHIHCCVDPSAATPTAIVATTTPTFPGFPTGVTSGTYDPAPFDLTASSSFNPAFVTASGGLTQARNVLIAGLVAGDAYFNIHTVQFPAGEIRGFLVPEPGIIALLALALGAAFAVARRRRS